MVVRQHSQTPEPAGPQFETLNFPLPDEVYDGMLRQMPVNHENIDDYVETINVAADTTTSSAGGGQAAAGAGGGGGVGTANTNKIVTAISPGHPTILELSESNVMLVQGAAGDQEGGVHQTTGPLLLLEGNENAFSDTDSIESAALEEDPNDPEWVKS